VPSVDRHAVTVINELMTEECVGWVAAQRIAEIEVTPYRHHPSGVHRWDRPFGELVPGQPLPAPPPNAAPVDLGAPEPLFTPIDAIDADPMITWNEPAFLDERPPQSRRDVADLTDLGDLDDDAHGVTEQLTDRLPVVPPTGERSSGDDWIDQLGSLGLPEHGSDPLASPIRLPGLAAESIDRFEMIWPSGEVDEQFGLSLTEELPNPDNDRVGPTACMVRDAGTRAVPSPPPLVRIDLGDDLAGERTADDAQADGTKPVVAPSDISDDVVMAVRRAVASIETGSLAARRRLADASAEMGGPDLTMPARLAVRLENGQVVPVGGARVQRINGGSVFDDGPVGEMAPSAASPTPAGVTAPTTAAAEMTSPAIEQHRAGALRRLIGSLRRR
jgi:hypothetical protein